MATTIYAWAAAAMFIYLPRPCGIHAQSTQHNIIFDYTCAKGNKSLISSSKLKMSNITFSFTGNAAFPAESIQKVREYVSDVIYYNLKCLTQFQNSVYI